jgi:hypothetical protein
VDRDVDATYSDKGAQTVRFMFVRAFNDATGASYPALDENRRELIVPPEADNWEFREYFFHEKIAEYIFDERVAAIQLILDDKYPQDKDPNRSTHIINQSNRCYAGLDDFVRLMKMPVEFAEGLTYVQPTDDSWKGGFVGKGDPDIHPAPVENSLEKYRAGLFLGQRSPLDWFNGLFMHQGPSSNQTPERYDRRQNPPTSKFGKAADIMMVTPGDENFLGVNSDGDTIHYVVVRRSAHVYAKHLGFNPGNGSFHIIPEIPPPKQYGKKISGDLEYAEWAANVYTELDKEDSQIVPVIRLPVVYWPWTPQPTPLPGGENPPFPLPVTPEGVTVGPLYGPVLPPDTPTGGEIQAPVTPMDDWVDSDSQALQVYSEVFCGPRTGEIIMGGDVVLKFGVRLYKDGGNVQYPDFEQHGEMLFSFSPGSYEIHSAVADLQFDASTLEIEVCDMFSSICYYRDTDDPRDTYYNDVVLKKIVGYPCSIVGEGRIWNFRAGDVLVDAGFIPPVPA